MAKICKITNGTVNIDMLTDDWLIERGGVSMSPLTDAHIVGDDPVAGKTMVISYRLATSGADHAALYTKAKALFALLRKAAQYNRTGWQLEPVWIEEQARTESGSRKALVLRAMELDRMSMMIKPADYIHYLVNVGLSLELEFPWTPEAPTAPQTLVTLNASDGPILCLSDRGPDKLEPSTATGGLIQPEAVDPVVGNGLGQFGEATENLCENSSGEVDAAGWATGGTNTIARSSEQSKFGDYSFKCTYQDNVFNLGVYAITLTAVAHSLGIWVYIPSDYNGGILRIGFFGFTAAVGTAIVEADLSKVDQWQFVPIPDVTPDGGDLDGAIGLDGFGNGAPTAGKFFYIDGIQCEAKAYPTPTCIGDMGAGHAFTGAAHASTSTRAAANLEYALPIDVSEKGTLRFILTPIYESDEIAASAYVLSINDNTADNRLLFYIGAASTNWRSTYLGAGAAITNSIGVADISRLDEHEIVITWDIAADEFKTYLNGVLDGTVLTGLTAPTAAWTQINIGSNRANAAHWSGWLDDVVVENDVWSAEEVAARYLQGVAGTPYQVNDDTLLCLPFDEAEKVHLVNFRDDVEITHFKENDGGAYTDLVPGDTLFPDGAVATNDELLWGSTDQAPKHVVIPKLATAGDLTTTDLHLYGGIAGPGWTELVLGTDYTCYPGPTLKDCLEQNDEDIVINVNPIATAAKGVRDGDNCDWIMLKEEHGAPVYATNPVSNAIHEVYAARSQYFEIPTTSLRGDHPVRSLFRLFCPAGGDSTPAIGTPSRFIFGARSLYLGDDEFEPMLNAGNQDNPTGWAVTYDADTSSVARPDAPGGFEAVTTFVADSSMLARCIFTGTNKLQYYRGKFEVFVGYWQDGGADEDINIRASFLIGADVVTSPQRSTAQASSLLGDRFTVASLGEIELPYGGLTARDELGEDLVIKILAELTGGVADVNWGWIYLNPILEWSGGLNDPLTNTDDGPSALRGATALDFDNGILARRAQKYLVQTDGDLIMAENWEYTGSLPSIEPNRLTRIYVLQLRYDTDWAVAPLIAETGMHMAVEMFVQPGFILLRGDD